MSGYGCLRDGLGEPRVLLGQALFDLFEDALFVFGKRHGTLPHPGIVSQL
jgi:hypothetical protein